MSHDHTAKNEERRPGPIPDPTPPEGMDWRDGLDRLDALLDDCSQVGPDHMNFVRVQAVRHIVNAVRRWEEGADESIRQGLWEDGVVRGEPWAMTDEIRPSPPDECHNDHPFVPGVSTDHAPGESDPRWCNTCGEARPIPPATTEETP